MISRPYFQVPPMASNTAGVKRLMMSNVDTGYARISACQVLFKNRKDAAVFADGIGKFSR
jgi:hypothetical protein